MIVQYRICILYYSVLNFDFKTLSIFIFKFFYYFEAKTSTNVNLANVLMEHQLAMDLEIVRMGLMKL